MLLPLLCALWGTAGTFVVVATAGTFVVAVTVETFAVLAMVGGFAVLETVGTYYGEEETTVGYCCGVEELQNSV